MNVKRIFAVVALIGVLIFCAMFVFADLAARFIDFRYENGLLFRGTRPDGKSTVVIGYILWSKDGADLESTDDSSLQLVIGEKMMRLTELNARRMESTGLKKKPCQRAA